MTKKDLTDILSEKTGIQKQYVDTIVDEAFIEIAEAIKRKEEVTIRGLFTLYVKERKEKVGRDMSASKTIIIPSRLVPKAKFSKSIKEHLKNNR